MGIKSKYYLKLICRKVLVIIFLYTGNSFADISVPEYDYSIPTKQYILPVIFATQDSNVPEENDMVDLYERGIFYEEMYTEAELDMLRANLNISQGLRLVQEKYRRMLKSTYREQGTFDIASWDNKSIEMFSQESVEMIIHPFVVRGEKTSNEYYNLSHPNRERSGDGENQILGEVYNTLNCSRYNCPFIPIIFYAAPNSNPIHSRDKDYCHALTIPSGTSGGGSKWNRGYNTGGGAVILPYASAINANNSETGYYTKNRFLSTLAHEIGHTFGIWDMKISTSKYYNPYSIMSYNTKNWHGGCWGWRDYNGFCYLNPDYLSLPDDMYLDFDSYVDKYPGIFAAYEKEIIGIYNSVIDLIVLPEDYICEGYINEYYTNCINQNIDISPPQTDRKIPGQGEITITGEEVGNINKLFGAAAISFPSSGDTNSTYKINNGSICINFPTELEPINLKKIIIYTGITLDGKVINKASDVEIYNDEQLINTKKEISTDGNNVLFEMNEYFYSMCVKFYGNVNVRGIRLFSNEEIFPPFEPRIFHELSGKSSGFVHSEHSIGTDRIICDINTKCNGWLSDAINNPPYVVIEFSRQTNINKVIVYSGYNFGHGLMGVAKEISIEKFENNKWIECADYLSGKTKSEIEFNVKGKLLKISFKPGFSGNVFVRGIRFFNDKEIFEPFKYPME